ncbi:MAG: hypothetical protein COA78_14285 [Blastopirellula sp.]|nr:MAG: hypothetical protein COA78_14285 [Blastopirellula sp.]
MSRSKNKKGSGPPERPNEQLASEYALGILTNNEKNRADALFVNDPSFRLMVEEWQERLAPMLDEVGEVPAPEKVWSEVESQLFGAPDTGTSASKSPGFWSSLVFWRRLSFTSIAAVAILFSIVALRVGEPQFDPRGRLSFFAALNLAENKPTFLVQMDMNSGVLNIQAANLTNVESRVPELWLIPEGEAPLSLGIIFADGNTALNITRSLLSVFKSGATLAISLEPAGGAPDGKPTGPIVATGLLQAI